MTDPVILKRLDADGILTVTINRPTVFNALNVPALEQLLAVFEQEAIAPEVRCVVLTGAGKAFCSGQDLEERRPFLDGGTPPALGESLRRRYNPLVLAIRQLPKPVVAAVNGVAAGAGCSLALACDMRLASDTAILIESFVRVGLGLDAGSSFMLPRLVGLGRAFELAWLGERIEAAQAERLGLVNRVVPEPELREATYDVTRQLAAGPPAAIGRIKAALNYSVAADLPAALEMEASLQQEAGAHAEYREGLSAFFQKRPPRF